MTAKMHQMRKPEARENVRVGQFNRSLGAFADEMGRKVALTLGEYDQRRIVPFAQLAVDSKVRLDDLLVRLVWHELPAWKRLAARLQRWWNLRRPPWDAAGSWHPMAVIPPEEVPLA
jgi:hypothetical protein